MKNYGKRKNYLLYILGILPVVWCGLAVAPYLQDGLPSLLKVRYSDFIHITWCGASAKAIAVAVVLYGLCVGVYLSSLKNYRRQEEYGSAKWGDVKRLNRKYAEKHSNVNKVLTQHVSMGYDGRKHRRNMNTLVCGGSGSGKTRFFAKPNILNMATSLTVLDPKGELLASTGQCLKDHGYELRVLNLVDMSASNCYNPFVYLRDDNDIQRLVTNLFKSTTPTGTKSNDPFWDQAAMMLLLAIIFYLHYEAPPEEQNFPMVLDMIRAGEIKGESDTYYSPLDRLFDDLSFQNPEHVALKYYKNYHSGSGKTLKSIQITLVARLEKFNLESLAGITRTDELELAKMGERKTALFAVIPDNDSSFNFLIGMLYTQLFQQLYYKADYEHNGRLPVHVHFLMDEFANVALPDEFDKILSTMRSREISVSIILQNMAQLKALFEKNWESIAGNCDEFLFLGGNEQSTHEYVSKLLGKETINTNTYGHSRGKNGSYSTNDQIAGRELLDAGEIRMLDNNYALLFIRGERPVADLKYDVTKHPNYKYSADGGNIKYKHGEDHMSWGTVTVETKKDGLSYSTEKNTESIFICDSDEINELLEQLEFERKSKNEKVQ